MNTSTTMISTTGISHRILWSAYNNKSSQMNTYIAQPYILNKTRERSLSAPHAAKTAKDGFKLGIFLQC